MSNVNGEAGQACLICSKKTHSKKEIVILKSDLWHRLVKAGLTPNSEIGARSGFKCMGPVCPFCASMTDPAFVELLQERMTDLLLASVHSGGMGVAHVLPGAHKCVLCPTQTRLVFRWPLMNANMIKALRRARPKMKPNLREIYFAFDAPVCEAHDLASPKVQDEITLVCLTFLGIGPEAEAEIARLRATGGGGL